MKILKCNQTLRSGSEKVLDFSHQVCAVETVKLQSLQTIMCKLDAVMKYSKVPIVNQYRHKSICI